MSEYIYKYIRSYISINIIFLLFLLLTNNHVFASDWQKYDSNPIFSESSINWDDIHVHNPSVFKINDTYNMWYDGNGGSGWQIGTATSINGITNWQRNHLPLAFSEEVEISDPNVFMNSANQFLMIYSNLNNLNMRVRTSEDGITWNTYSNITFQNPLGSWANGGILRGRSTLLINDKLHMWFTAKNTLSIWAIGYAISDDGVSWIPQNNGNPIKIINEDELVNVSFPSVVFKDGIYHIWYGSSHGQMPTQINYAYSNDGINWTKPNIRNPALLPGTENQFDQVNITPSTILIEGDQLKMYYSGYANDGHWRIGYATASASILSTPTPDPTPTITPPPQTRQVIVVPGATASWNPEAILLCKSDNYSGEWTLAPYAESIYNPLMQALTTTGWSPNMYLYDWRKSISENETDLKNYINGAVSSDEKVNVVGHSMGGLIGRSYLETEQSLNKLEKLLTVGSPHTGSIIAYPLWSAGKVDTKDPNWKFLTTTLIKLCSLKTKFDDRLAVQTFFPGANNLLPIFNYLIDKKTNKSIKISAMNSQNSWLNPTPPAPNYFDVSVGTLRGTGQSTAKEYHVESANPHDENLGNWSDGKPVFTTHTNDGDGTVLFSSAQLPNADNSREIPADHSALMYTVDGISNILNFLGTPPETLFAATTNIQPTELATTGLYVAGFPGNFWIMDPTGHVTKDKNGLTSYINPRSGNFKFLLIPSSNETIFVVSQILPNDKILWKEYTLRGRLPKFGTINFNEDLPLDDPVRF